MNILGKLHVIEREKNVYNICYCKAGVGFCFYDEDRDTGNWREALVVEGYYEDFEKAVQAEFEKLNNGDGMKKGELSGGELLEQLDDYKKIYLDVYHPAETETSYIEQVHKEIVALVKKEYTEELIGKWANRGK